MNTHTAIIIAGALIAGGIYAASENAGAQSQPSSVVTSDWYMISAGSAVQDESQIVYRVNTATGRIVACVHVSQEDDDLDCPS